MTLRERRLFYLIFILIFLIVAPILVLYTTGYRYNFQKRKIEQIGVLFLNTKPKEADLWLNNSPLSSNRPLRLSNLHPNYYLVRAEKEGYFTWQKNLEVKSKESTLAYDIALFKNTAPLLFQKGAVAGFQLSPSNSSLITIKNNTVWLYDLENDKEEMIGVLPFVINQPAFQWSPNEEWVLIYDLAGQNCLIVEAGGQKKVRTWKNFDLGPLNSLSWAKNSQSIYAAAEIENNNFYEINFLKNSKKMLAEKVATGKEINGEIYFIKNAEEKSILYRLRRSLLEKPLVELAVLPLADYKINDQKNDFLSLSDSQNQIYLIDLSDSQQPLLRLNGNKSVWGEGTKNNFLYYYDKSEVWILDPETKKSYMLGRYDEEITKVLPLYDIPYFLLQLNNRLLLGELDDRDKRQFFTLFEEKNLKDAVLDKTGKQIYFIDKLKNEEGIFKLDIQ